MIYVLWMTAAWLLLTGELTLGNLLLGLVLSAGVRLLVGGATGTRQRGWSVQRLYRALQLSLFFLSEVVVSGVTVAIEVLRPRMQLQPAIVAIPVPGLSPTGVMVVANMVTMTPGSLSVYMDEEAQVLYVHAMHVQDADAFRRKLQRSFVRRVQEVVG